MFEVELSLQNIQRELEEIEDALSVALREKRITQEQFEAFIKELANIDYYLDRVWQLLDEVEG